MSILKKGCITIVKNRITIVKMASDFRFFQRKVFTRAVHDCDTANLGVYLRIHDCERFSLSIFTLFLKKWVLFNTGENVQNCNINKNPFFSHKAYFVHNCDTGCFKFLQGGFDDDGQSFSDTFFNET